MKEWKNIILDEPQWRKQNKKNCTYTFWRREILREIIGVLKHVRNEIKQKQEVRPSKGAHIMTKGCVNFQTKKKQKTANN